MKLDAKTLGKRLQREKKARLAAEAMIEKRSRELFDSRKEVEAIFAGGIKMLTDVLALARPEVFQKAAKVQRWVRLVVPALNVKRPWELDLAAMLYPLGVIGLPDELALKYAHGQPISKKEQIQINNSTQVAYKLINDIDRMHGVANAVLYSKKNFDGTGSPKDSVRGKEIPQNARILKVLIDLADAATGSGVSRADGFRKLTERKNDYDLDILKVCVSVLLKNPEEKINNELFLSLPPGLLKAGDIVARDIVDIEGKLLLASGLELSEMSIGRLSDMSNNGRISGEIYIERTM